jgi:hypothetical protein
MKQFGRPRHKWENNIKRNLKGIRYESVDWIHLAHVPDQWWTLVNIDHGIETSGSIKGVEFLD